MLPIDKCMTTLRLLLPEADPKGIPLAEQAIDQLIAAQDGPSRQIRTLHMLEEKLTPIWESATGKQLNFLNVLFDYITTSMTAFNSTQYPHPGHWASEKIGHLGKARIFLFGGTRLAAMTPISIADSRARLDRSLRDSR